MEENMGEHRTFHYRSIFWPIVLIGVGVIWLLASLGVLPNVSWGFFLRLWPLILIVIGLDLIFGRRSPIIGALIGLATVALVVVLVFIAPILGFSSKVDVLTERFSAPIGSATSAQIELGLSVGETDIHALSDSNMLFDAEISHVGSMDFQVSGENEKDIRLSQLPVSFTTNWWDWSDQPQLRWDIGLTPDIPLRLKLEGGVGKSTLDFSGLQLTGLEIEVGVGGMQINLPATGKSYEVRLNGSVGESRISIEEGAEITMDIQGGVGNVIIDIPNEAAVRLEANTGVGRINVPSNFLRTRGNEENIVGESGTWESEGFSSADRQIFITFEGGVGSLTIR
jgi:hypothetical protein